MARRKKISGVDGNLVLGVIILAGGAFAAWKLGLFGTRSTDSHKADVTNKTNTALANDLAAAQKAGISQGLSMSTIQSLAGTILNNGEPYPVNQFGDSQSIVVNALGQLETQTDWILLQQAFGTPKLGSSIISPCNFTGWWCDATPLTTFIVNVLDAAHLQEVNDDFQAAGIQYQFPTS